MYQDDYILNLLKRFTLGALARLGLEQAKEVSQELETQLKSATGFEIEKLAKLPVQSIIFLITLSDVYVGERLLMVAQAFALRAVLYQKEGAQEEAEILQEKALLLLDEVARMNPNLGVSEMRAEILALTESSDA